MLEKGIKSLLEDIVKPIKVSPIFGIGKPPFITYIVKPISGGVVKESQLEVRIIEDDFAKGLILKDKINKVLDMLDNKPSLLTQNLVIRSKLSGGGSLYNDSIQMWEISNIYIVKWRDLDVR